MNALKSVAVALEGKSGGSDGKYFQTTKKGEIHELKQELNALERPKVKEAVKKVIAAMTVGKDVSGLFSDVVKSMQTDDIELKKLVYLYIINYARTQPEQAIMVVNTFQRDATDPSPLVRALAIRTMGLIRVEKIAEHLAGPLSRALKDTDPYVRKTAAVCVAKLHDFNADMAETSGFLDGLRALLGDPNPIVVANAVSALAEIADSSGKDVFKLDSRMLAKLVAALGECTEWGQVAILDCLAKYQPTPAEAEDIVERVAQRLKHANSAVAMSAVKVILRYLELVNPELAKRFVTEKLAPPLITLLAESKPEIQYVALRNMSLIVQKHPTILASSVKHFFCKYNDPVYVKMEKVDLIVLLANNKNIDKVLLELKEYANEVDVEFARKSVSAIGRAAIKLDRSAEKCVKVLVELIQTKISHIVQEAVVVIKDIFRQYPNRYESVISTLCQNLDSLDLPEAKASMVWIVGEYADGIDNAPTLLASFVDSFPDEPAQVQLAILTAAVKVFLKRPDEAKDMVTQVLNMATESRENPDLRDRGYIYWRLLSTDPDAAQAVVLAKRSGITDDLGLLAPSVLDSLLCNMATVSSVFHKPPEVLLKGHLPTVQLKPHDPTKEESEEEEPEEERPERREVVDADEPDTEDTAPPEATEEEPREANPRRAGARVAAAASPVAPPAAAPKGATKVAEVLPFDLLGGPAPTASVSTSGSSSDSSGLDLESIFGVSGTSKNQVQPSGKVLLNSNGLEIRGSFARADQAPGATLKLHITNTSSAVPLSSFAIRFDDNELGLSPSPTTFQLPLKAPGTSGEVTIKLSADKNPVPKTPGVLRIALKTDGGVVYFKDALPAEFFFQPEAKLDKAEFLAVWKRIPDSEEQSREINTPYAALDALKQRLSSFCVYPVVSRSVPDKGDILYATAIIIGTRVVVEATVRGGACTVVVKAEAKPAAELALLALSNLLR